MPVFISTTLWWTRLNIHSFKFGAQSSSSKKWSEVSVYVRGIEGKGWGSIFFGINVSEHLKGIIRALRSLEQLYLVSFLHTATSFKRHAVACVCVCSSLCTVLYMFVHSCLYVWCVIFHAVYSPTCVYKDYFPLFIFVIPCCAFLPWHSTKCCFFSPCGLFHHCVFRTWGPEGKRKQFSYP